MTVLDVSESWGHQNKHCRLAEIYHLTTLRTEAQDVFRAGPSLGLPRAQDWRDQGCKRPGDSEGDQEAGLHGRGCCMGPHHPRVQWDHLGKTLDSHPKDSNGQWVLSECLFDAAISISALEQVSKKSGPPPSPCPLMKGF